jgi:hypothetical protein
MDALVDPTSSKQEQVLQMEYLQSLSPKEVKSVLIAADHLGMSFQLKKSVGFLSWKKQKDSVSS